MSSSSCSALVFIIIIYNSNKHFNPFLTQFFFVLCSFVFLFFMFKIFIPQTCCSNTTMKSRKKPFVSTCKSFIPTFSFYEVFIHHFYSLFYLSPFLFLKSSPFFILHLSSFFIYHLSSFITFLHLSSFFLYHLSSFIIFVYFHLSSFINFIHLSSLFILNY